MGAGYLITDNTEKALVDQGIIPADQIPLIIQDKTFVPDVDQLAVQDPTWDMAKWGGLGNLWLPHVYSPAQNPGDSSGVNQFGRWAYGPWFWPPVYPENGPVPNPYFDPNCDPDVEWCEPPEMPGTPYNSMGMEAQQVLTLLHCKRRLPIKPMDPVFSRARSIRSSSARGHTTRPTAPVSRATA